MTRIAKLRQRITILEVIQNAPDGIGGVTTTKSSIGEFWARVERTSGSRTEQGGAAEYKAPVKITIRSGAVEVSTKHLIRFEGIEYTVTNVNKDEVNRLTTVNAWARVE
jgi:head-tail adaptor